MSSSHGSPHSARFAEPALHREVMIKMHSVEPHVHSARKSVEEAYSYVSADRSEGGYIDFSTVGSKKSTQSRLSVGSPHPDIMSPQSNEGGKKSRSSISKFKAGLKGLFGGSKKKKEIKGHPALERPDQKLNTKLNTTPPDQRGSLSTTDISPEQRERISIETDPMEEDMLNSPQPTYGYISSGDFSSEGKQIRELLLTPEGSPKNKNSFFPNGRRKI